MNPSLTYSKSPCCTPWGCKNRPTPFPGSMTQKWLNQGLLFYVCLSQGKCFVSVFHVSDMGVISILVLSNDLNILPLIWPVMCQAGCETLLSKLNTTQLIPKTVPFLHETEPTISMNINVARIWKLHISGHMSVWAVSFYLTCLKFAQFCGFRYLQLSPICLSASCSRIWAISERLQNRTVSSNLHDEGSAYIKTVDKCDDISP